jgi:DNA integrity scanning protein DisA with diadenylate cyclase activity
MSLDEGSERMADPALSVLRKATKGLLYMSEMDAPFKVVALKDGETPSAANVAELLGAPADSPVEEVAFGKFFGELTKVQKWHAEDDKAVVKRYQDLLAVLRESLSSLKVFKVGRVRVKIAILGKTDGGNWAGLSTESLET